VVFGAYDFRFREQKGQKQIYDTLRKKYVTLTPEEWVRQHVLRHLIELGYSAALIAVERGFIVNDRQKRFDVVVYDRDSSPFILVECKAENEPINPKVLMQVMSYNLTLQAKYFWLTNGTENYFMRLSDGKVLTTIPSLSQNP
jgi:hypothetical protein